MLAQHRRRQRERVYIHIQGIEPRRKETMPEKDKDKIQRAILRYLTKFERRAFRGPIALQIRLGTTEKNPNHLQHIAKNLLDLFGEPNKRLKTRRRGLLYDDDEKVHALSVTCRHGETEPSIWIIACPLESLLIDLDLATKWARDDRDRRFDTRRDDRMEDAVEEWREIRRDEERLRERIGQTAYEAFLRFSQQRAQDSILSQGGIQPRDLAAMYDRSGQKLGMDMAGNFERLYTSSPLRIRLSSLPQERGSSEVWKREIDEKLRDFQKRYRKLIEPWLVPVALEVLVKPPKQEKNTHDLDNIVRSYLIPKIVDILKPVSDLAFTFDPETIRDTAPEIYALFHEARRPPASTKIGVTRYEVWRLRPAIDDGDGFVSVALVADSSGVGDTLRQIEDMIGEWRKALEDSE